MEHDIPASVDSASVSSARLAAARRAMSLQAEGRAAEALAAVEQARASAPNDFALDSLRAALLAQTPDAGMAAEAYAALTVRAPREPRLWLSYGHVLKMLGRREAAISAYRQAIIHAPGFGEAYWSLANLKVLRLEAEDIGAMRALLDRRDLGDADRTYLHFALGKALEDDGRFDEAFDQYRIGAARRRAASPYDPDAHHRFVKRSANVFDALANGTPAVEAISGPIFIVGLPRSGSTLLEQMLAAHGAVEGLSELPVLPALAAALARRGRGLAAYPELLLETDPVEFITLGRDYFARVAQHRRTARPLFVDKFPGNVLHLALIQLALPGARIIDVRRDPMDCCLSLYKQCFAAGQTYSYNLADLGRYYSDYVELTAAFDSSFPDRMLQVRYESLVTDPERVLRQVLDYCDIEFEPACLNFHKQDRVIRTPSAEQVRRPLSTAGFMHWRNFERHLEPLRQALTPSVRPLT